MSVLTEPIRQTFLPPATWSREEVLAASDAALAMPAGIVGEGEHIFRLSALGLGWDIGVRVYEPTPSLPSPASGGGKGGGISRGADGKKIGIFLLHGGAGDFKSMEKFALIF